MSERDISLLLLDMIEAGERILKYTKDLDYEDFIENELVVDAVARNFEIIGEAANQLDADFQDSNPDIEWPRIIGFRNRLIHGYFGIDYQIVWTIIEENISELIDQLKELRNQSSNQ